MSSTTKPITEAMMNGMLLIRDRRFRGASPIKATWMRLEREGYVERVAATAGVGYGHRVLTEKGVAAINGA